MPTPKNVFDIILRRNRKVTNRPRFSVGDIIYFNPPGTNIPVPPDQNHLLLITKITLSRGKNPYHYTCLELSTGLTHPYSIWYINNLYSIKEPPP